MIIKNKNILKRKNKFYDCQAWSVYCRNSKRNKQTHFIDKGSSILKDEKLRKIGIQLKSKIRNS